MFRTADSALIREVSFIWSVLYREVPLCMSMCEDIHTVHYRVRYECTPGPSADYDAPVNEFGQPTIKFLILREILPNRLPDFGKYITLTFCVCALRWCKRREVFFSCESADA